MSDKPSFRESATSFIGAVLIILAIRWLLIEPYVIPSGSMIPSLLINDHIVVNKLAYGVRVPFTSQWLWRWSQPERGEVVVFRSVEEDIFMIKRVIARPGDEVAFHEDGSIELNGSPIPALPLVVNHQSDQSPFYEVKEADLGGPFEVFQFFREELGDNQYRVMLLKGYPRQFMSPSPSGVFRVGHPGPLNLTQTIRVPEGHYLLLGDNRDNSRDSRYWGLLPEDQLLGRAVLVWLSCDQTLPVVSFLCNPITMRWSRLFHVID